MTNRELSQAIRKDLKEHGITSKDVSVRVRDEMYLNGGSTVSIRDYNNAHNIPTKRGGEWTSKTVADFLRNPINKGAYRYYYRESARGRKKPNEEVVFIENAFPPLVEPRIWELVNKRMDEYTLKLNTSSMHTIRKNCNVFAGLIVC